jgi:hypothetical protein
MRDKRERDLAAQELQYKQSQLQETSVLGHTKQMGQEQIAHNKDKTMRDIAAAKESNRLAEVNLQRADSARPKPVAPKPAGAGPKNLGERRAGAAAEKPKEKPAPPPPKPFDAKPLIESHKGLMKHVSHMAQQHAELSRHVKQLLAAQAAKPAEAPKPKKRSGKVKLPSGGEMNFEMNDE